MYVYCLCRYKICIVKREFLKCDKKLDELYKHIAYIILSPLCLKLDLFIYVSISASL